MASSKWKTWEELADRTRDRKVIFWGSSNWIERTLEKISLNAAYIVDNNRNNQGIEYSGLNVKAPEVLRSEAPGSIYIVITTASYLSVIDELADFGLVTGDDYCCTPLLNERRNKDELKALDRAVLVSSPMHYADSQSGGGLYRVQTRDTAIEKVYSGKVRGVTRAGELFLLLDMLQGLVLLDASFKQIRSLELQPNSEPHGICYDQERDRVYIGQPGRDSIAVYSLTDSRLIDEIFISDKWSKNRKDNHHVNDLCLYGGSLYVSLFSFSGNWLQEVYDGGILEIDADSGKIQGPVVTDLWMPHSVKRCGGRLTYVDSMRGELRNTSHSVLGKFNGFARGLDFDGKYYYIGTTEHRYPEKLLGISNNISLDTGFYAFDPDSRMSRFFALPQTDSVHSILVLNP